MADFTGFLSKLIVAWPDDVDLPEFADTLTTKNGLDTVSFPVSYYINETFALDDTDVKTITWPTTGSSQLGMTKLIWARVVGSATIVQTGTDPNSAAATTATMETTGIAILPGIILLYVIGAAGTFTVTGNEDGTTVQILGAII
jgi:hypothetical protein